MYYHFIYMNPYNVKITAVRKVQHTDLSALYENPIEHACEVHETTQANI